MANGRMDMIGLGGMDLGRMMDGGGVRRRPRWQRRGGGRGGAMPPEMADRFARFQNFQAQPFMEKPGIRTGPGGRPMGPPEPPLTGPGVTDTPTSGRGGGVPVTPDLGSGKPISDPAIASQAVATTVGPEGRPGRLGRPGAFGGGFGGKEDGGFGGGQQDWRAIISQLGRGRFGGGREPFRV